MSSAGFPTKSGGAKLDLYRTNGMIIEFGQISSSLQSEYDQDGSNPVLQQSNISLLVGTIINFQNKYCGLESQRPAPFTRFPSSLFTDYKVHGHLHRLLRIMISYCAKQAWWAQNYRMNPENQCTLLVDLSDTSLTTEFFAMFQHIERELKKQSIIKPRVIHFSPSIPISSQQHLSKIARRHGASIAEHPTPDVTHIILPNNVDMEDSGEECVRTIAKDEAQGLAFIHYWFYPSSYDQWINSDLIS